MIDKLRQLLADELVFSHQVHTFHWNVSGVNFGEFHALFGDIYEKSHATLDTIAEYILIKGSLAPSCLADTYRNKSINETTYVPGTAREMIAITETMNRGVLNSIDSLSSCDPIKDSEVLNYAANLRDIHGKWGWMLNAYLK